MNYREFIESKQITLQESGFDCNDINKNLFDYQKDLVKWALKKGKSAIFAMTGLGKTAMQCEWAYQVHKYTNKPVLILAPLAVALQTVNEAKKILNVDVKFCESSKDVINGLNITNYEKLHNFDVNAFIGVVLDESSILKSFTSATRNELIDGFKYTPYKLACSATPAPNDFMELGNHSEFLNEMTRKEMLSMFFVNDQKETQKWRLKGHAQNKFWEWVASWGAILSKPSDLGYSDDKYKLPELFIHEHIVENDNYTNGKLFVMQANTLQERRDARKNSLQSRCNKMSELVNDDIWCVWCDLNTESELAHKLVNGSVEVKGSDKPEHKTKSMLDFADGKINCLVSKPSICGFGMNFQICHNVAFLGLSDSFEQYFQAVRRFYRFGQTKDVHVHIIVSEAEGSVLNNIKRKEKDFYTMLNKMVDFTKQYVQNNLKVENKLVSLYNPTIDMVIPSWLESEEK